MHVYSVEPKKQKQTSYVTEIVASFGEEQKWMCLHAFNDNHPLCVVSHKQSSIEC